VATHSPFRVIRRRHSHLACASTSSLPCPARFAESIGETFALCRERTRRITGSIVSNARQSEIALALPTRRFFVDRAPLMRFLTLQRLPAVLRCPGRPASGLSRFAEVMRCCSARGRRLRYWSIRTRRVNAVRQVDDSPAVRRLRSVAQVRFGGTESCTLAIDSFASSAAALLPPLDSGHAPTRFLARCSATRCDRAFAAWPGEEVPSLLISPGSAHGFIDPSQVCSRRRVKSASLRLRAHVPVAIPHRPRPD